MVKQIANTFIELYVINKIYLQLIKYSIVIILIDKLKVYYEIYLLNIKIFSEKLKK